MTLDRKFDFVNRCVFILFIPAKFHPNPILNNNAWAF